jgi:hypothetical protein
MLAVHPEGFLTRQSRTGQCQLIFYTDLMIVSKEVLN